MYRPHRVFYVVIATLLSVTLWPLIADADQLATGQVLHMTLRSNPDQQYLLYLPTTGAKDAPIFVTVHGVSRNVEEHAARFAPYAAIASPFFAKPEMDPSDFGSEKLATGIASGGPRSSCVRQGAPLRGAPWLPQ